MRYALDLAMMAILVLEMSFLFMPRPFHEILGGGFFGTHYFPCLEKPVFFEIPSPGTLADSPNYGGSD